MASADVLFLSSPIRPPDPLGSSPGLPSPSEILAQAKHTLHAGRFKSNICAEPILASRARVANSSVRTATTASKRIADVPDNSHQVLEVNATESSGLRSKGNRAGARASRVNNDEIEVKPVPKKAKIVQTKIKKGMVQKIGAPKETVSRREKKLKTRDNDQDRDSDLPEIPLDGAEDLGLEEAVKRRARWTPPKENITILTSSDPPEPAPLESAGQELRGSSGRGRKGFSSLCRSFGFADPLPDPEQGDPCEDVKVERATKKRRLEPVTTTVAAANDSPGAQTTNPKPKASKRKARTITEQATAFYAVDSAESTNGPLLQYLPRPRDAEHGADSEGTLVRQDASRAKQAPSKTKTTSVNAGSGPKSARRKSKKDAPTAAPLLSPRSACKQIDKQDVIFGTSSQLAREESPGDGGLRRAANGTGASCADEGGSSYRTSFTGTGSNSNSQWASSATSKGLWSAAARDDQGLLTEMGAGVLPDVLDQLPTVPSRGPKRDGPVRISDNGEIAHSPTWRPIDDDFMVCPDSSDDELAGYIPKDTVRPHGSSRKQPEDGSSLTSNPDERVLDAEAAPRLTRDAEPLKKPSSAQDTLSTAAGSLPQKPDFNGYPTTQLTSTLTSYGFKPVKSRKQMIALLEKCWEGQQRAALKNLETNTKVSRSAKSTGGAKGLVTNMAIGLQSAQVSCPELDDRSVTEEAEKSNKGSRKKNTTALHPVSVKVKDKPKSVEIGSSGAQPCVSPARPRRTKTVEKASGKKRQRATTPTTVPDSRPASPAVPACTEEEDGPERQGHRFASITRAIRSERPSTSAEARTWHEKILMYDPVVLEDLAAWLNTRGLAAVAEDFEVGPAEVREWCQAKGVCCLWRENLRGETRRRR